MAYQGFLGIVTLVGLAWIFSENRRANPLKIIGIGLAAQFVLAFILLKLPLFKQVFLGLNATVQALQEGTRAGTSFVFGYLGGGALPFAETFPGASFVLAFQALPLILVMSALSALLFHWKVLPVVVRGFAWGLERAFGISGAAGFSAAANVFVGMVEAPLLVRPYIKSLSRGELFMVMTCGMATIAGTVMVIYATFLQGAVPDAIRHLVTASLISAPAAIMVAKVMIPEEPLQEERKVIVLPCEAGSSLDAISKGATSGVMLLINVAAMLVVLVALVSLANQMLGLLPEVAGGAITLQRMLGFVLAPLAWLMGIPWAEAQVAGGIMGVKTVLNEFLANMELGNLPEGTLSERSRVIMTYALCGFANFGSLGIMIGGLGAMAPERRDEVVNLGMKSILSGTIATFLTGAIAGIIV